MGRTPSFPPRLTRKPGTTEARTCYRGTYYTCGKWDARTNRPSAGASSRWAALVAMWSADPDAVPGGEDGLRDLLADWLEAPDSPVHQSDREWVPTIIRLLEEWNPAIGADQFGGRECEAWQAWLCGLVAEGGKLRYSRRSVSRCVKFVARALRWAARNKLHGVTWDQYHEVDTVPAPKPGRVRDDRIVMPAEESTVLATTLRLHPQLSTAVCLLWWTGARPSELLGLRKRDILTGGVLTLPKTIPVALGDVWAAPVKSKMSRLGHVRCLIIGPRAKSILAPLLDTLAGDDYLFAPVRSLTRAEGQRRSRKVGPAYTVSALRYAVSRACGRASVPPWHPYQLRHACSARVRAAMGTEAEAAYLGHGGKTITDRYSGWDSTLAAKVALACG